MGKGRTLGFRDEFRIRQGSKVFRRAFSPCLFCSNCFSARAGRRFRCGRGRHNRRGIKHIPFRSEQRPLVGIDEGIIAHFPKWPDDEFLPCSLDNRVFRLTMGQPPFPVGIKELFYELRGCIEIERILESKIDRDNCCTRLILVPGSKCIAASFLWVGREVLSQAKGFVLGNPSVESYWLPAGITHKAFFRSLANDWSARDGLRKRSRLSRPQHPLKPDTLSLKLQQVPVKHPLLSWILPSKSRLEPVDCLLYCKDQSSPEPWVSLENLPRYRGIRGKLLHVDCKSFSLKHSGNLEFLDGSSTCKKPRSVSILGLLIPNWVKLGQKPCK